jgi:alpha-tubulin suppressor-like RCC1 family protein
VLSSGAVKCWGHNIYGELGNGQLGNGDHPRSSTPVSVIGISTAVAIAAGRHHYCARLRDGSVDCWGNNSSGQLGKAAGVALTSSIPVGVIGVRGATKLTSGANYNCTLLTGGLMTCWGSNSFGELGNGVRNYRHYRSPVNVLGTPGVVWKSSDLSRATITDRGVATGRATGNTTITATTAGFINDNAVLTVK